MERFEDLITSNIPVLVDFFAEWCGPCKAMKPILEELKGIKGEKVRIVKVDVDKHKEIAAYYQIQSVPTLMISKADYFSSTLDANCEDKEASLYAATATYYLSLVTKGEEHKHYADLTKQAAYFALSK